MIDHKDRTALLKVAVYAMILGTGALLIATLLGVSVHLFRLLSGV